MTYSVDILRSAQKKLAKIDSENRSRILTAIRNLAGDLRPPTAKKLSGRPAWRIRVGPHRVIYEIYDDCLLVLIIEVGHRRDIYR